VSNLFKKALAFTDIHYGLKNNSTQHNTDCDNFVDWAISIAKEEGCETGFFLGDWHHNRAAINLHTLDFSLKALEKLNNAFENFYFIVGNHDLYYRDKRDIHSVSWAKHLKNIKIVDEWFNEGGVAIIPWLVKDDHKLIKKVKAKYVFGHFELPHFKMNANIRMPDTGTIHADHFNGIDYVFSGHFHIRQQQKNIHYIGNAFPHNYSDDGDTERGCMTLEWGKKPVYHNWSEQPSYATMQLSNLLENADSILKPRMHARVTLDVKISFEESTYIKETFVEKYQLRELSLVPVREEFTGSTEEINLKIQSVDQIVHQQIGNIESDNFNTGTLIEIYNNL
jgi:DNA repair exonuclease SbcCD nuclease subunit